MRAATLRPSGCAAACSLLLLAAACTDGGPSSAADASTGSPDAQVVDDGGSGDASVPPACCVELAGIDGEPAAWCSGHGALEDEPGIVLHAAVGHTTLTLSAAQAEGEASRDALSVQGYEAVGTGSYLNPQVQYWNAHGTRFDNGGMNGNLTVTSWGPLGHQLTGSFRATVYNKGGEGAQSHAIEGVFCARRR